MEAIIANGKVHIRPITLKFYIIKSDIIISNFAALRQYICRFGHKDVVKAHYRIQERVH